MNSNHRANPTRTAPRIGPHRTIAPTSIEAGVLAMRAENSAKLRSMSSWLGELGGLDELDDPAQCLALSELARSPRRPGVGHDGP